jgi:hypothetical protein
VRSHKIFSGVAVETENFESVLVLRADAVGVQEHFVLNHVLDGVRAGHDRALDCRR